MLIEENENEQTNDIPKEYQDYLARLEQDYLATAIALTTIRDFLLTLTANAANVSLCYLAIELGLGVMSAGLLGFSLGSITAGIDLGKAGINLASDYKIQDISKVVSGGGKLIAAVGFSWNATNEHRQLMHNSYKSIQAFEVEVKEYEFKVQPTEGLTINFQVTLLLSFSAFLAFLPVLLKMFRRY